jgi:hypothetical protein
MQAYWDPAASDAASLLMHNRSASWPVPLSQPQLQHLLQASLSTPSHADREGSLPAAQPTTVVTTAAQQAGFEDSLPALLVGLRPAGGLLGVPPQQPQAQGTAAAQEVVAATAQVRWARVVCLHSCAVSCVPCALALALHTHAITRPFFVLCVFVPVDYPSAPSATTCFARMAHNLHQDPLLHTACHLSCTDADTPREAH